MKRRKIGPGVYVIDAIGTIEMDQWVIDDRLSHGLSVPPQRPKTQQDYICIIAREVYDQHATREQVPDFVEDAQYRYPGFKALYMRMSNLAIKRFDNAVWRRVEELKGLQQ